MRTAAPDRLLEYEIHFLSNDGEAADDGRRYGRPREWRFTIRGPGDG